jgi:hydroxylamine dehydrogenase
MKDICVQCHTPPLIDRVYQEAEAVVESTNEKILGGKVIMDALRQDGVLTGPAFNRPIDFKYFDLWHYYGRTSKHGAFMGGADFIQWHGNYPILQHLVEIRSEAEELRKAHGTAR